MAITYFPFNSVMVNNKPDRAANAETLALYLKTFFTNGIVLSKSAALQVKAKTGLTIAVQPGTAFVDGRIMHSSAVETFTLDGSSGVLNRIDRVVLRLDYSNRLMKFLILKGEEGSEPTAPAITRSADIYDMCLADVYVGATATEVTQANITDKRADTTVCGIAAAAITQLDTSTMYEQYTAQFEEAFDDLNAWTAGQKTIIEDMIADIQSEGFAKTVVYTTTIPITGWTQMSGGTSGNSYSYYTKVLTVSGILASDNPIVDVVTSSVPSTAEEQLSSWGDIYKISTQANQLVLIASEIPEVSIPIQIKVVR